MQNQSIVPTDDDIESLKSKIEAANRVAEYQKLTNDLQEVVYKAAHAPTEFDGAMQIPDTDKILKTKRSDQNFVELLLNRVRGMFSIRPVIGNVIAIIMSVIVLFYIYNEVSLEGFGQYQGYFGIGCQLAAALAIIKSSTRSLILPFLALIFGGAAAHSLGAHNTLFHFDRTFYEHLMIVGIVGLCFSIMSID